MAAAAPAAPLQWNPLIFKSLAQVNGPAQAIAAKMAQIKDPGSAYAARVMETLSLQLEAVSLTPAVFEGLSESAKAQALGNAIMVEKEQAQAQLDGIVSRFHRETLDIEQIRSDANRAEDLINYESYYFDAPDFERLRAVNKILRQQALSRPVEEKLSEARLAAQRWLAQDPSVSEDPEDMAGMRMDPVTPSADELSVLVKLIEPLYVFAASHQDLPADEYPGMNPDHWKSAVIMLNEAIVSPDSVGGRRIDQAFEWIEALVTSQANAAKQLEYGDARAHVGAMTSVALAASRLRTRMNNAAWGKEEQRRLAWNMRAWMLEFIDDALGARDPRFKTYEGARGSGSAQYYKDWQSAMREMDEILYTGPTLEQWRKLHRLVRELLAGYADGTPPEEQRLEPSGQKLLFYFYRLAPLSER